MTAHLTTPRLVLRPWVVEDAGGALGIYGATEVTHWLAPVMEQVRDLTAMEGIIRKWVAEDPALIPPAGRWAIETREGGQVVGGATLLPRLPDDEYEIGWQLHPDAWGRGYATEAGLAVARWAFQQSVDQVIALVRPANTRAAATARRIGLEWVGETEKYHGMRLQEYRLRPADLVDAAWVGPRA
jgi:[ribosomal protein S5]-alanine N-acetyltransferase